MATGTLPSTRKKVDCESVIQGFQHEAASQEQRVQYADCIKSQEAGWSFGIWSMLTAAIVLSLLLLWWMNSITNKKAKK